MQSERVWVDVLLLTLHVHVHIYSKADVGKMRGTSSSYLRPNEEHMIHWVHHRQRNNAASV